MLFLRKKHFVSQNDNPAFYCSASYVTLILYVQNTNKLCGHKSYLFYMY